MQESEKWKGSHSVVSDSATPWTATYQASPSMGFSRQEYWNGVPLLSCLARGIYFFAKNIYFQMFAEMGLLKPILSSLCIGWYFLFHQNLRVVNTAKLLQLCPTLCDPIDGSPPGSPVPGILQARTMKWVAISFSNAWKWKVKGKSLSRVWPLAWTIAYQAPPSMGFSRQENWSGVPLPSPKSC